VFITSLKHAERNIVDVLLFQRLLSPLVLKRDRLKISLKIS